MTPCCLKSAGPGAVDPLPTAAAPSAGWALVASCVPFEEWNFSFICGFAFSKMSQNKQKRSKKTKQNKTKQTKPNQTTINKSL
jgi:hypothetical protein